MKIKKRFYRIDPLQQNAPQQLIMTHLISICFIIMRQWLNSGLVKKKSSISSVLQHEWKWVESIWNYNIDLREFSSLNIDIFKISVLQNLLWLNNIVLSSSITLALINLEVKPIQCNMAINVAGTSSTWKTAQALFNVSLLKKINQNWEWWISQNNSPYPWP